MVLRNLTRFDLSDRLIHFTRQVDLGDDGAAVQELQREWGFATQVENERLSPFFLLRQIIRQRQIVSTRSFRRDRPTIYGPDPAVCFTEMPVAAFLQASEERSARGEHVSKFAILVRKAHAYDAGARPVIY